jgi:hypothetical protein
VTPLDKWIPIAPIIAAFGSMFAGIAGMGALVVSWINGRVGRRDRAQLKAVMNKVQENTDGLASRNEAQAGDLGVATGHAEGVKEGRANVRAEQRDDAREEALAKSKLPPETPP